MRVHPCPDERCYRGFRSAEDLARHQRRDHADQPAETPNALSGWIPGRPVPWQRTRAGRRLDARYREWLDAAVAALRDRYTGPPMTGRLWAVVAVSVHGLGVSVGVPIEARQGRLGPPLMAAYRPPGIKGDLDNYVKAAFDAAGLGTIEDPRAGWIIDDGQIVWLAAGFTDAEAEAKQKSGLEDHHDLEPVSRPSTAARQPEH